VLSLLIEEHIRRLTGLDGCAKKASEILRQTAHLIKARSVAYGSAQCIFKARLVEAFGASGFFQSIIPGKGSLVHQILAISFPYAFIDFINDDLQNLDRYINEAVYTLEENGMIPDPSPNLIATAKKESVTMLERALDTIPEISERIGLKLNNARVYTEIQLMSYKLHIWGVLDALIEDHINQRAIVIDWKTREQLEGRAAQIGDPDIAQVCAYAMLVADRLGFEDPRKPVLEGKIVPIIIRPRGKIPVAGISPAYKTMDRRLSLEQYLNRIILTAEHLTLTLTNVRKLAGSDFDKICRFKSSRSGRRVSAFRYTPSDLPRGNPENDRYPCNVCGLREECLFYIRTSIEPEEIDRLAWRSRFAIYSIRENALQPYKEIHDKIAYYNLSADSLEHGELFTLEGGSRIDIFDEAEAPGDCIIVKRDLRKKELEEDRIITIREGKPAALFFHEEHVRSPLLRLCFVGRVDEVTIDEDNEKILVTVGAPNIPSRLHQVLFKFYLKQWGDLTSRIIGVETNVDLTQLELRAIDAFQRGTRRVRDRPEGLDQELEKLREEALEVLFGKIPRMWGES